VRQHIEGMVESTIRVLFEIYFTFQQWNNFKNPLKSDKLIAMSLVYYFLGDSVYPGKMSRKECPTLSLRRSDVAKSYSYKILRLVLKLHSGGNTWKLWIYVREAKIEATRRASMYSSERTTAEFIGHASMPKNGIRKNWFN